MKPVQIHTLLCFLMSAAQLQGQDTIRLILDIDEKAKEHLAKGHFGFYAFGIQQHYPNTRSDTLLQSLHAVPEQKIFMPSLTKYPNFIFNYFPFDTLLRKMEAPLYYLSLKDHKLRLDNYFFRESITQLDNMHPGDTLHYTIEYKGPLVGGQKAERSSIRIIRKKRHYVYSRNDLSVQGNPTTIIPDSEYRKGYSEKRLITEEQLALIRKFEKEIVNSVEYDLSLGYYEVMIQTKNRTHRFFINSHIKNDTSSIWELLK